ncbi:VOC family protein [Paenibacillus koleovorans]|uniref:VOC family protein n=1 Tax=Paenibacillus koleovorans TaxID=121608 RepID=UPI000FDAB0C5|nr:VOC family protein [Paenibacillus koleovorans]
MRDRIFIWVEIPVSDMGRAKAFYERILDLEMQSMQMGEEEYAFFPVKEESNGGMLVKGPRHKPSPDGVTVYIDGDPDLALILSRVPEAGGQIIMEKTYLGDHAGYIGMFLDSEGNRVGLQHM